MSLDDRNAELEHKLEENPIDNQIAVLVRADRRRKWQVLALTVIIAVLTVVAFKTFQLARLAQSNREAVVASCETSNEARKNNTILWDFILKQPSEKPLTAEQQRVRNDFIDLKNKTFAPRDCQAEIDNQK